MYYMTIFGYFLSWYKCVDVVYTVLNSWMRLFCFLFIQNTTHLEVKGQRWHQAATFKCSKCKIQETSLSLLIWAQSKAKKKNFPSLVFHSYSLSESVGGVFFLDQWHLIYHTCVIWMPFSWVKWTRCELKPLSGCQLVDLSVSFFKTPSARSARTKKKKRIKQKKKNHTAEQKDSSADRKWLDCLLQRCWTDALCWTSRISCRRAKHFAIVPVRLQRPARSLQRVSAQVGGGFWADSQ